MHDRRDQRRAHRQAGFTILELMLVVTTLLILAGITAAQIVPASRQFELSNGARGLSSFLKRCRTEAVRLNTTITCRWAVQEGGQIFWIDQNGDEAQQTSEPAFFLSANLELNPAAAPGPASTGLTTATEPDGDAGIAFNPRGGVSYPAGDPPNPFILSLGHATAAEGFRSVTVTQLGTTRVWTASQSTGPWRAI